MCEGAEKWVAFSAEDSTGGRRVSIWFEEEEKIEMAIILSWSMLYLPGDFLRRQ